jgi:hypothetical protein
MATQDKVALELAERIISGSSNLLEAIETIKTAYQWGADVGINFTDFSTLINENGETQHTEPEFLNKAAGIIIPALETWLDTQVSGPNNYREILQHNRK